MKSYRGAIALLDIPTYLRRRMQEETYGGSSTVLSSFLTRVDSGEIFWRLPPFAALPPPKKERGGRPPAAARPR